MFLMFNFTVNSSQKKASKGVATSPNSSQWSEWDVPNVIIMYSMFINPSTFNVDVSEWDVSSVIDMQDMFYVGSVFNSDISNWYVSSVTDMQGIFAVDLIFNGDKSKWDVSRMFNIQVMFSRLSRLMTTSRSGTCLV